MATHVLGIKDGKRITVPLEQLGSGTGLLLVDIDCDTLVNVGDVVYMDAAATAHQGDATDITTSNIIGTVESKNSSILCNIRVSGRTAANYIGLDVTKEYFLSDTVLGGVTTIPPSTPGHVMVRIGQPLSATELVINKGQIVVRA